MTFKTGLFPILTDGAFGGQLSADVLMADNMNRRNRVFSTQKSRIGFCLIMTKELCGFSVKAAISLVKEKADVNANQLKNKTESKPGLWRAYGDWQDILILLKSLNVFNTYDLSHIVFHSTHPTVVSEDGSEKLEILRS